MHEGLRLAPAGFQASQHHLDHAHHRRRAPSSVLGRAQPCLHSMLAGAADTCAAGELAAQTCHTRTCGQAARCQRAGLGCQLAWGAGIGGACERGVQTGLRRSKTSAIRALVVAGLSHVMMRCLSR